MKVTQPEFGVRLRNRRIELGLSQRALADDVVTPSYISLLERGDRIPTLDVVVQLAQILDTSVADLLGSDAQHLLVPTDDGDHAHLMAKLEARRFADTGDLAGARRTLEARLASAEHTGGDDRVIELGVELSAVLLALGEHAERLRLLDRLAALPLVERVVELQVALTVDRTSCLRELGRMSEAREAGYVALKLIERSSMVRGREHVRALGVLGSVLCELGEFETAGSVVAEMLDVAAGLDESVVLGRTHWLASMAYARMGRLDLAANHLREARRFLSYGAMPTLEWLRLCRSTAAVLLELGDYDTAREWIEAAEVTVRMAALSTEEAAVKRERARYEFTVGNIQAAADLYASVTGPETPLTGLDLATALLCQSEALHRLGRLDEAIEVLRRTAALCDETGNFRQASEAWRRIDELRRMAAPPAASTTRASARRRTAARSRASE